MDNEINQIIIECQLYVDEVGITHGFFSAKLVCPSRTLFMAPFDSMEEAVDAVKHQLITIRVLYDPFPDPERNPLIPRDHPNCPCFLISDKNAEEAS